MAADTNWETNFKRFLAMKLPQELLGRLIQSERVNSEEDIPLEALERAHSIREKTRTRMILGYHVANNEYAGEVPQSKRESITIAAGEEIKVLAGNAHYSTSPRGLYKMPLQRDGKKFLYLVEGSSSDFSESNKSYTEAHRGRGWVSTARPLPIIFKTEIDNDLERELGLQRV